MFRRSHHDAGPWTVVRADSKKRARLEVIKDLLRRSRYPGRDKALLEPDRDVLFEFEPAALTDGRLAR